MLILLQTSFRTVSIRQFSHLRPGSKLNEQTSLSQTAKYNVETLSGEKFTGRQNSQSSLPPMTLTFCRGLKKERRERAERNSERASANGRKKLRETGKEGGASISERRNESESETRSLTWAKGVISAQRQKKFISPISGGVNE